MNNAIFFIVLKCSRFKMTAINFRFSATILYVFVLMWLPSYFSHQHCAWLRKYLLTDNLVNFINCHLKFPKNEMTFEAYASWLTAVFASAAFYWAWKSFRIQDASLSAQTMLQNDQQRANFALTVVALYKERLAVEANWLGMELQHLLRVYNCEPEGVKEENPERRAFGYVLAARASLSDKILKEWADQSSSAVDFFRIFTEYDRRLTENNLIILKHGYWTRINYYLRQFMQIPDEDTKTTP